MAQQTHDGALVILQPLDLSTNLGQTPRQDRRGRLGSRLGEKNPQVRELQPGAAIGTDLPKTIEMPVVKLTIVSTAARRTWKQSQGFVVEDGGPADAARTRQLRNGEHRFFECEPYSFRQVKRNYPKPASRRNCADSSGGVGLI